MASDQHHSNGPSFQVRDNDPEEPLLSHPVTTAGQDEEPTGAGLVGWVILTAGTQVLWGLYPVASRYIETVPANPLPPFRVITYVNLASLVVMSVAYTGPRLLYRRMYAQKAVQNGPVSDVPLSEVVTSAIVLGVSVSCLAAGMIISSFLTPAFLTLLMFMFAPLAVGPLARIVLGIPMSPLLWPTVAATLFGAGLTVHGGLSAGPDEALGTRDFLGMGIALFGMLGQAVFMVWVQKTSSFISNDAILYINYATMLSFAPLTSLLAEKQPWSDVLHYNFKDYSSLAYLSVGVYCIGNLLQQVCVRKLGAPVFAVFISVRLLASVAGSWIILGEKVANATEAAGCIIIALAVTGYLCAKAYTSVSTRKRVSA